MVLLRDIRIESYCEHHIVPILGTASIAYFPDRRVVGISKLARVIDIYAKRMQTQETMTAQIADAIQSVLQPRGVALIVVLNAGLQVSEYTPSQIKKAVRRSSWLGMIMGR